jgi:hypothetical protein
MTYRRTAIVGIAIAAPLALAGCGSSSSGGQAATPPAAGSTQSATAPTQTSAPSSSSGATFDGDFTGTLSMNLCTSSGIGSVKASVDGDSATNYLGSVSGTELSFMGPSGGIYSTKPGDHPTVSSDGNSFNVDGLVLTDDVITHKSVTVHGTLTCP